MSFMISRETENIQSLSEVEGAFRAITANGDKPYVTKDEIFQVLTKHCRYKICVIRNLRQFNPHINPVCTNTLESA